MTQCLAQDNIRCAHIALSWQRSCVVEYPHSMASPDWQAFMDLHAAQMRDFFAAMFQQQQTTTEAMLNNERGRPAAQAQGINEKYYKRVESFNGEQAWRDWAFQFKPATKTANEAAHHLIETAEKEEKEIDDVLSLSEAE